jgi:hypothetical protein
MRIMCKQAVLPSAFIWLETNCTSFHTFFAQVDHFREPLFLYLSTRGIEASKGKRDVTNVEFSSRKQRALQMKAKGGRIVFDKSDAGEGQAEAVSGQTDGAGESDRVKPAHAIAGDDDKPQASAAAS